VTKDQSIASVYSETDETLRKQYSIGYPRHELQQMETITGLS
jgi:hypothetical protein